MNKSHTRQISGIGRDTTEPQMLRHLPLSAKQQAHPLVAAATWAVAICFGCATAAAIVSLILSEKP